MEAEIARATMPLLAVLWSLLMVVIGFMVVRIVRSIDGLSLIVTELRLDVVRIKQAMGLIGKE